MNPERRFDRKTRQKMFKLVELAEKDMKQQRINLGLAKPEFNKRGSNVSR